MDAPKNPSAPTTPATAAPNAVPSRLALASVPAIITLLLTLIRLGLELGHAPPWLASRNPGGGAALLGISWLPFVVGPWIAFKLARVIPGRKQVMTRTFSTLVVYGYLARIPVFALFFLDIAFGWGTHYAALPPQEAGAPERTMMTRSLMMAASQLGFWPIVWTGIVGSIAAFVALSAAPPKPTPAAA